MAAGSRSAVLVLTHVLALGLGFAAVAAFAGQVAASRSFGTAAKQLGGALASLFEQPTAAHTAQALNSLRAASAELGEPTVSVLELRILAVAAGLSGATADVERAASICQSRNWPKCDRASLLAMGARR